MGEVFATPRASADAMRPILSVRQIEKVYGNRDQVSEAPSDDISSWSVMPEEHSRTSGHIFVDGRDITGLRARSLAKFRRDDLGFIFQTRTCWTRSRDSRT